MNFKVPCGKRSLIFSLPASRVAGVLQNKSCRSRDIGKAVERSLDREMVCGKTLAELAPGKEKILVVVPDATRNTHLKEILPHVLNRIAGSRSSIDIIVATGLHKKHTRQQMEGLIGRSIVKKYNVLNHEQKASCLTRHGIASNGVPISLNSKLGRYDLSISIGLIEPHLYAGYSGGAKTAAIGLAGEETINATHSIRFLDDERVRLGAIKDNPFQKALCQIALKAGIDFAVNIVNDPDGQFLDVFAGEPKSVFKRGVRFARSVFEVKAKGPADIVICGVGYPKDVNLYQASRAINYIVNVDRPILNKGGAVIVVAGLKDGIGDGLSEKRFYREMKGMADPETFIKKVKRVGCVAGEHRAYMVARALAGYKIAFVTKGHNNIMAGMPFRHFDTIRDALAHADLLMGGKSKIYIVPHALATIARLGVS